MSKKQSLHEIPKAKGSYARINFGHPFGFKNATESTKTRLLSKEEAFALSKSGAKISLDEYRALRFESKVRKYRNKPTEYDGERFDSKWELEFWKQLKLREKAHEIEGLKRQVRFEVQPNGCEKIVYVADFVFQYIESTGPYPSSFAFKTVAVDAKGIETGIFKLKAKLFRWKFPNIELRIEKKLSGKQWKKGHAR